MGPKYVSVKVKIDQMNFGVTRFCKAVYNTR